VEQWLGKNVGSNYRITEHLASGAMGHVFLSEHRFLGVRAAVKVASASQSSSLSRQLANEARLLSQAEHPRIVRVFDVGTFDDGSVYMLMEYVSGLDLADWLDSGEARTPERVLRILRQLASAIDALHELGILHRDIKTSNVMLDADHDDAIKLIDFGIAVREGAEEAELGHMLCGTPAYMAPEQVAGGASTRASDLYAFGALALELITGKPPYDYQSPCMILQAVLLEDPALPRSRGIACPGLDAVFERALARDPNARFASAREFADQLAGVLQPAAPARSSQRHGLRRSEATCHV
jgi:serine/threonine-protein kinase